MRDHLNRKAAKGEVKEEEKKSEMEEELKRCKNGEIKKSGGDRKSGKSCTTEPFRSQEELQSARRYFREKAEIAEREGRIKDIIRWYRNYALFVTGINTALRISDILNIKWEDILDSSSEFYDKFRPKEKKTHKFNVKFIVPDIQEGIFLYKEAIEKSGLCVHREEYIFKSFGRATMTAANVTDILKKMARECGFKFNINTHTMRKTFAYWYLMIYRNDVYAIDELAAMLNHDSIKTTLRYAGFTEDGFLKRQMGVSEFYKNLDKSIMVIDTDIVSCSFSKIKELTELAYRQGAECSDPNSEDMGCLMDLLKEMVY